MRALFAGMVAIVGAAVVAVAAQDPKLVDEGKKLYTAQKCADCHTIGGKGGRLMKNSPLDSVGSKLPAADIKKWLTHPAEMEAKLEKPKKPSMSSKKYALKDPEVEALTAYMLTLKK
jgi:mono/diheme cytochrome c family protein